MIKALVLGDLAVARGERVLFARLSARLSAGEAMVLVGPNGSGKTSLLRAIAGLIRPFAGEIRLEAAAESLDLQEARRSDCHLLSHLDGLKSGRSAGEELDFQVRWTGGGRQAARAAAERLGLTPLLELPVRALSAGQRRRVALGRLLAAPRALWLLDEPLSPLDAHWRREFGLLMADHLGRGGLIVAASHDILPVPARSLALAG